jgi:hypothetical protein
MCKILFKWTTNVKIFIMKKTFFKTETLNFIQISNEFMLLNKTHGIK